MGQVIPGIFPQKIDSNFTSFDGITTVGVQVGDICAFVYNSEVLIGTRENRKLSRHLRLSKAEMDKLCRMWLELDDQ